MSRFTDFVRKFAGRAEISETEFAGCLAALAGAIRSRLERMGMSRYPPAYFGYPELDAWDAALDMTDGPTDPVLDAFDYAVTSRLDALAGRLEAGVTTNIDGLIHLNVKHFLYERQRDADPVGHAVYENLAAALLGLADRGAVTLDPLQDGTPRNTTMVRLTAGAAATPEELAPALAAAPEFDRLYAQLARVNAAAQSALADLLPGLERAGVRAFRFGDLVALLKDRTRQAHDRRNRPSSDEAVPASSRRSAGTELIRIVRPDDRYSNREEHEAFLRRIRSGVAAFGQERTRRALSRLLDVVLLRLEAGEDLPPLDELSRLLGVSRSTAHEHLQKLQAVALAALNRP